MIENAYPQASFDPRILKLPLMQGQVPNSTPTGNPTATQGLLRGYIKQDTTNGRLYSDKNALYACAFLYNPSTVEITHGIDGAATSLVNPQYARNSNDNGTYLIGLQANLSFSLLFDRTYEVNSLAPTSTGNTSSSNYLNDLIYGPNCTAIVDDPRLIGVLADINALYRICGINAAMTNQTWTDSNNNTHPGTSITGMMQQVPSWCHFGAPYAKNSLSYYGFISGLDIQYTHFSQAMTPMRCAVAVSFTLLPSTS